MLLCDSPRTEVTERHAWSIFNIMYLNFMGTAYTDADRGEG